ncbi:MAG TPA: hypothetical protein VIV83_01950 [Gemmatimonadales bacterium]
MPVTAKLSRTFYEKFGDDIANELVDWFNMVDATYRGELRELNELNFSRFDDKLERRVAELSARIDHVAVEFKAGLAQLESKLEQRLAEMRSDLETRLIRWMFGFWIAQAAATVGLMFGVVKLLK